MSFRKFNLYTLMYKYKVFKLGIYALNIDLTKHQTGCTNFINFSKNVIGYFNR